MEFLRSIGECVYCVCSFVDLKLKTMGHVDLLKENPYIVSERDPSYSPSGIWSFS